VPDVDVVIPTWNGRGLLESCLRLLADQTVACRVIVVDNGSSDGTAAFVRESHPEVTLLELPENRGFARAVNPGIEAGSAPYVVLVNNDVDCDPTFIERIVAPLRSRDSVGMVAGLLLRPGRRAIDGFGIELDRTLAGFARFDGAPYPDTDLHDRHLAGPSGGAAAYRRRALEQVGTFDEGLFAYMEDVDLALRLRAGGWGCAGAADAIGVHLGSATFGRRSRAQVEIGGAARAYMLRKYGVLRRDPPAAAWALAAEAGVVAVDTVIGRDLAALRGRLAGWRAAGNARAPVPSDAVNPEIGFREALRRRRAVLAARS
jgi:GT2 family glycosyltransferase